MAERQPYDVFLSYSAREAEIARALAARLRKAQLRVFLDEDSIRDGENIHDAVDDAVRRATVAVVLIGPTSGSSKWLSAEVSTAASGAMTGQSLLVPVLVGDVVDTQVPAALRRFPAVRVDAPEGLGRAADAIWRAVIEAGRPLATASARLAVPALPDGYVDTEAKQQVVAAIEASTRDQSGPVQVIGPPGAGKTTTVVAACQARADQYELLGWITATTEHAVIRGLAQLARRIGVSNADFSELDLATAAVGRLADKKAGWLLVFDDADGGERWLARWMPPASPTGTAVVISRRQMTLGGLAVRLQPLDDAAALSIFENRLGGTLSGDARRALLSLLAETGDLTPLTLAVLAGHLRSDQGTVEGRVDRLLVELRERAASNRPRALGEVAAEALRDLATRSPVAVKIGQVLASVGETAVPAVFFRESADDPFLGSDASEVAQAIVELEARGLIQTTSGAISAHPVVVGAVRVAADPVEPLEFLRRAAAQRRSFERPDDRELTLTTDVARHALTESVGFGSPAAVAAATQLCIEVAVVLWDAGDLSGSVALLEATLQVSERTLGPGHEATMSTRANLAGVLRATGRLDEAAALLEQTLSDSERVLGPDHPSTLTVRANLAAALQASGRLDEAAALLEQTLSDSERVLGPDHPSTLTVRANLAAALQASGRLDEAAALLEQTLSDSERVLGPDHPSTLTVRANLAAALQASGRLDEAAALLEQTLSDSERVLGPDHPSTLTVRANLAAALQASGRLDEAAALLEQTLSDSERVLGPDHPSTLTVRANLAAALQASGRLDEAAALLEQTLSDSERVLGPDHPSTLTVRANLAAALQASGRLDEAAALLEQTLSDSERVLGPRHRLTMVVRENLKHARRMRGGSG